MWPHPDLDTFHASRAALLHQWSTDNDVEVLNWGNTDAQRAAEYVEIIVPLAQTVVGALIPLVIGHVRRFYKRKQEQEHAADPAPPARDQEPAPPIPLMAVNVVNQAGGMVVFLDHGRKADLVRLLSQVENPDWKGREELA